MTFQLVCIEPKELTQYKSDMQEAFQKGFEDVFGKTDAVILPEKDIDQSLNAEGSAVYKAVVDGEMVGGLNWNEYIRTRKYGKPVRRTLISATFIFM